MIKIVKSYVSDKIAIRVDYTANVSYHWLYPKEAIEIAVKLIEAAGQSEKFEKV